MLTEFIKLDPFEEIEKKLTFSSFYPYFFDKNFNIKKYSCVPYDQIIQYKISDYLYNCIVLKVDYSINDFRCHWYLKIINENMFCPRDNNPYTNSEQLKKRCVNYIFNEANETISNCSFFKDESDKLQKTIIDMARRIFYDYTNFDHFLCVSYPKYREAYILNYLYAYYAEKISTHDFLHSLKGKLNYTDLLGEFNKSKEILLKCFKKENYIIAYKDGIFGKNELKNQQEKYWGYPYGMTVKKLYNDYKVDLPSIEGYFLLICNFFDKLHEEEIVLASTKDLTYKVSIFFPNIMVSSE
ncbi:hypothetical protein COBT_000627, partial [Conglomerata obtusa]